MGLRIMHITTVDLTAYCFLRTTFRHLRGCGHQVALATTFERFRDDLEPDLDECLPVRIPRRIRPFQDLRALWQLVAAIRRFRPQIVHTHTSKAGLLGRLAARLCGVPLVIHTVHELPQNSTRNPRLKTLYWALEKLASHWCDHFTTQSHVNREQILAEGICPPEKLSLIRVGLDLNLYRPALTRDQVRSAWSIPAATRLLGMAGRLEAAKGHADLLAAFALLAPRYPDLHLVVIGRGELQTSLEELRDRLGLRGRVTFQGWVEDLISSLAALDLFVLSSHYEGLGVVLLEALALEVPVVSTRVGGTQDVIEDGVTGVFAPAHDPSSLAAAVEKMLADPGWARQTARAGRRRVEAEFQAVDSDRRLEELYRNLWGRRPSE